MALRYCFLLHVQRTQLIQKCSIFYCQRYLSSQTTATSPRFCSFVELAVNILFLLFGEIAPLYFGVLFEWTHVAEQHVSVALFEFESGMREVES